MPPDDRQRLGMDRQRFLAVPGLRSRPVSRVFRTLVWHPQGAARRRMDDAQPSAAQYLAKFLSTRPARRLGGLPHLRAPNMMICIVTPAPPGSRKGNRLTAERWARLFVELGHR